MTETTPESDPGFGRQARSVARIGAMMARSGLLRPGRPDKLAAQLTALKRWGTVLGGSFTSAAARDPGQIAIVDPLGELTYAQVDSRTNNLAAALRPPGAAAPKVAVLCRNHRGMVEALIACSKAGADLVLLNTGMSLTQLLTVLDQQEAGVLVVDPEFAELIAAAPEAVAVLRTDTDVEELMKSTRGDDLAPPDRPGRTIVLSSGTTGQPKGADRKPSPGLSPVASMLSRIPLRVHDTMFIEAPLFHTWGYAALQLAISMRATIVLRPRFDAQETLRLIAQTRTDVLVAVPVMLQRILELTGLVSGGHDTSSLRIVAVSGSALPGGLATAFMNTFGDVLYNLYGSTESSWVTIATPRDLRAEPDTAGTAPPGTRLAILDDRGRPVPAGSRGRIFAANELMFAGYTNGAAKEMHDGLMSLGDIGHLDAHGRLFVHGRDDDMVVSGGENVFPGEVEDILLRLPQVREVAVVGVADAAFGQRLAAYVVVEPGHELTAAEVDAHARANVARFAVPRDVVFLEALPRNATGKIVRRDLPTV
ncbi:MAG: AMP-binding protein [Streptosporangiaceae bacterium]